MHTVKGSTSSIWAVLKRGEKVVGGKNNVSIVSEHGTT